MAAPDEELLLAGGTLIAAPTNVNTPPEYGGTILGTMQSVGIEETGRTAPILAEEYGGEEVDAIFKGSEYVCTTVMANWDDDALSRVFPGFASGAYSYPNATLAPGGLMSSRGVLLMFAPADVSRHPGFKLYRAVPLPEGSAMLWSGVEPLMVVTTWLGYRDTNEKLVKLAKVAGL